MKIRMTLDGRTRLPAMLVNGAAARDFAALLPLELSLKDYASTEKIADLPKRLSIEGEPEGFAPAAGAIAYYAPWGNLAIFYRDFSHSAGLVQLGRLENASDVAALARAASVRIERDE